MVYIHSNLDFSSPRSSGSPRATPHDHGVVTFLDGQETSGDRPARMSFKHRQGTLQRLTELHGEKLTDMTLVTVRKLSTLHAKNNIMQQQIQKHMTVANTRSSSRISLVSSSKDGRPVPSHRPLTQPVGKPVDVVRLLAVWDKYKMQQLSKSCPGALQADDFVQPPPTVGSTSFRCRNADDLQISLLSLWDQHSLRPDNPASTTTSARDTSKPRTPTRRQLFALATPDQQRARSIIRMLQSAPAGSLIAHAKANQERLKSAKKAAFQGTMARPGEHQQPPSHTQLAVTLPQLVSAVLPGHVPSDTASEVPSPDCMTAIQRPSGATPMTAAVTQAAAGGAALGAAAATTAAHSAYSAPAPAPVPAPMQATQVAEPASSQHARATGPHEVPVASSPSVVTSIAAAADNSLQMARSSFHQELMDSSAAVHRSIQASGVDVLTDSQHAGTEFSAPDTEPRVVLKPTSLSTSSSAVVDATAATATAADATAATDAAAVMRPPAVLDVVAATNASTGCSRCYNSTGAATATELADLIDTAQGDATTAGSGSCVAAAAVAVATGTQAGTGTSSSGGGPPVPLDGQHGPPERWAQRNEKLEHRVIISNPAGFSEDAASCEVAGHQEALGRARLLLSYSQQLPTDQACNKALWASVQELHMRRPYLVVPSVGPDKQQRPAPAHPQPRQPESAAAEVPVPEWSLDDSVFAPRLIESDAKDFYDSSLVRDKQLVSDWHYTKRKTRFRRLLASEDGSIKSGDSTVDKVLQGLFKVLSSHRDMLRSTFTYYSMASVHTGHSAFTIASNEWRLLLNDCAIPEPSSRHCRPEHCDTIFISTNFEEEKRSAAAQANLDDKLMRFELYEALVRVAMAKYIKGGSCRTAVEALQLLLSNIKEQLPPEALHEPNSYRRERVYTQEVNAVLLQHQPLLQAVFNYHAAKYSSKEMTLDAWLSCLETYSIIGDAMGVSKREGKLLFAWSQMMVVDDVQRRQRAHSLVFTDFLEGLARLADLVSPPPLFELPDLLQQAFDDHLVPELMAGHPYFTFYNMLTVDKANRLRRPSAQLLAPKTQPLHKKLASFMQYLRQALHKQWETCEDDRLIFKMNGLTRLLQQTQSR